jgi:hypothetical protein
VSFYGSVYYQLIDTFYKVVLRNRGADKKTFLAQNNVPEWLETQAVGRKGVFGFDSGNRWINLNTYSENKPDSNEQFSIYEIYHGAPDSAASKIDNGFKVLLSDSEVTARTKDGVIHLQDADEFETYENKYDDAGHIASSVKKVYRLPKAEVNDKVDRLEELVGDPASRTLPTLENEKDRNLYGYVEENSKDITSLESYVGDWKGSTTYWDWGGAYGPTIVEAIGNLDDMYGTSGYQVRAEKHQPFSKIIGNLPELWKKFNKENYISLSDIILKQQEDLETLDASTTGALSLLNAKVGDIGTRPDGYDTVYTEVIELHGLVDALTKAHAKDKTDMEAAYKAADQAVTEAMTAKTNALEQRATNAENAIKTINDTTIPAINTSIGGINDRVTAHETSWAGSEKALADKDKELAQSIADLTTTVNNKDSAANTKIDDVQKALNQSIKAVSDSIGTVTEGSTVVKMIDDGDKALAAVDAELRKDVDATGVTANANVEAIKTINEKIGTVGDKALSVQITENLSAINSLNTNALMKSEAETTYAKKTELDAYAKSSALEGLAKSSDVTEISGKVDEVVADIAAIGLPSNFSEEIPEGSTALAEIFSRLTKIETDIADIKTAMNTLHTDNPPFPEKVEE